METTTNQPTEQRLREVFSMVESTENWKNPIDATIPTCAATRDEITAAVIYFTGSVPKIEAKRTIARFHPDALVYMEVDAHHVTAAGYYATIGA